MEKNIWFPDQQEPILTDDIADKEAYVSYWRLEKDRCINGFYLADGQVFVPGRLYFHTVYWKIAMYVELKNGKKVRQIATPLLRDIDWDIFQDLEKCNEDGKFYALVGSRDFGKSIIAGSCAGHQYTFYPNSECVMSGGAANYIKLATDKVEDGLLNVHTIFKKQRLVSDWKKEVRAGWKDKSTKLPNSKSSNSRILVRNYQEGTDTMAANGTRPSFHLIDEIGTIPNLIGCIKDSDGCWWSGGGNKPSCLVFLAGTGGDMNKGKEAAEVFFAPYSYNILEFENEWEGGGKIGRFISALRAKMAYKEKRTLSSYLGISHPDLDNITILVSNEEKALKEWWEIEYDKAVKSGNSKTILKFKAYWPLKPSDSFIVLTHNNFNTEAAKAQQARLKALDIHPHCIEIFHDGEKLTHRTVDKLPITEFPLKTQDPDAPIQMWEAPIENAPFGLYVAGCLLPGEKVLTERGLINVENVTLFNKLINKEGNKVEIYNLQRYLKKDEDVYKIKMSNTFRTTTFTKEHPIYVSDPIGNNAEPIIEKRFDFNFTKAENVKEGQWIKVPNIFNKKNDFDIDILWDDTAHRIDRLVSSPLKDKDFWWFIGLFLGDGWCNTKKGKISISFNKSEVNHIDKFIDLVARLFNRSVSLRKRDNCIEASFTFDQLHIFLTKHFNKYAGYKKIPDWAKRIDQDLKHQFILGYLDSDGCILYDKKRGYYTQEYVSINLELLEDFQDILLSLGYISSIELLRNEKIVKISNKIIPSHTKKTYRLRIGHNDTIKFKNNLSTENSHKLLKIDLLNIKSTVKSPKKGCFISECGDYIYFKITKIDKTTYSGWVYNFECDTNTFMCHRITTHNCDPYRQGQAEFSDSLGAVYIFKRINNITGEGFQNMFVAAYVARPESKEKWNETARNLIKYYNARTLCENDEYSFIDYMISKGDGHFLEDQPEWLKEYVPNTTVKRGKGIHRSSLTIRNFLDGTFKSYLDEIIHIEKDENGSVTKETTGVSRIPDIMLLEEVCKFSTDTKNKVNTDRVVAAELAVALAFKLNPIIGAVGVTDKRIEAIFNNKKKAQLFAAPKPLFKRRKRIF